MGGKGATRFSGSVAMESLFWAAIALFVGGCAASSSPQGPPGRPAHCVIKSPITYITDCKDENGKGRCVEAFARSGLAA